MLAGPPLSCMHFAWWCLAAPALGAALVCSACHTVLGVSVAAVTIRPYGSLGLSVSCHPHPSPECPLEP